MKRWLLLPLAIAFAAVAAYALLSVSPAKLSPRPVARQEAQGSKPAPKPPFHAEIGDESREQLLEILREAEEGDQ